MPAYPLRSGDTVSAQDEDLQLILDALAAAVEGDRRPGTSGWVELCRVDNRLPLRLRYPLPALLRVLEEYGYVECAPSMGYVAGKLYVRFSP